MPENKDLKKVSKVIELGGDIQKLEMELKSLESKKIALLNEMEQLKKNVNKSILEDRKVLSKDREKFESETAISIQENIKKENELKKREKQIEKKEKEFADLEDRIASHNELVLKFVNEKKSVDNIKKECLEKEHLAELKIKEFDDKIKELQKGK